MNIEKLYDANHDEENKHIPSARQSIHTSLRSAYGTTPIKHQNQPTSYIPRPPQPSSNMMVM